jgi:hypothetical protein
MIPAAAATSVAAFFIFVKPPVDMIDSMIVIAPLQ